MSNLRNFTVYSKSGCPYCGKIIQVLDHIKASYTVYSLNEHFDKDWGSAGADNVYFIHYGNAGSGSNYNTYHYEKRYIFAVQRAKKCR